MKTKLKVPNKYQKFFGSLEVNDGTYEDCKYVLYFADGYAYEGEYPIWFVNSKKEALECLKDAEPEKDYEELKKKGLV